MAKFEKSNLWGWRGQKISGDFPLSNAHSILLLGLGTIAEHSHHHMWAQSVTICFPLRPQGCSPPAASCHGANFTCRAALCCRVVALQAGRVGWDGQGARSRVSMEQPAADNASQDCPVQMAHGRMGCKGIFSESSAYGDGSGTC